MFARVLNTSGVLNMIWYDIVLRHIQNQPPQTSKTGIFCKKKFCMPKITLIQNDAILTEGKEIKEPFSNLKFKIIKNLK